MLRKKSGRQTADIVLKIEKGPSVVAGLLHCVSGSAFQTVLVSR
jgi:hypothetical protein